MRIHNWTLGKVIRLATKTINYDTNLDDSVDVVELREDVFKDHYDHNPVSDNICEIVEDTMGGMEEPVAR